MTVMDQTGSAKFEEREWPRYHPLVCAHFTAQELARLQFVAWLVEQGKLRG